MKIFCTYFWILLVLSNSMAIYGSSTWMFISNIALSTPIGRHLCDQMPLAPEQKQYCERHPSAMSSIQEGARLSMKECQYRFRESRWNCSVITQSQGLFAKIIQRGSREAAFVHAITSAGVTYAVTQACSRGELENCSCDKKKRGSNESSNNSFVWGGCSDDIKYGMKFAQEFVDATETDRYDAKASMNRHNNRVGRRAVRKFINRKCKCHGPTATCPTRTCWDQLDNFHSTGQYLKTLYDKAVHVTISQDGSIVKANSETDKGKSSKAKLVYLESSPNYCNQNPNTGSLGTAGRECNNKTGEGGCDYMCCGRGYDTRRVLKVEDCNCKFQWCCEIVCQTCRREVDVHTCRAESNNTVPIHSMSNVESLTPNSTPNKVTIVERKRKRKDKKRAKNEGRRKKKRKRNRQGKKKRKPNTPQKISRPRRDVKYEKSNSAELLSKFNLMNMNLNRICSASISYRSFWKYLKCLVGFT